MTSPALSAVATSRHQKQQIRQEVKSVGCGSSCVGDIAGQDGSSLTTTTTDGLEEERREDQSRALVSMISGAEWRRS